MESRADGVHDGLTLHLAPVGSVVDYDGRNYIASMGVPVFDFLLNNFVLRIQLHPIVLFF